MPVLLLAALTAGGLALVAVGVAQQRRRPALDVAEFLRALEGEAPADDFEERLAEPFLQRVLRPLLGRLFGVMDRVTPAGRRDSVQRKILTAGLAGKLRADEFLALQGAGVAAGFLLAIVLTPMLGLSGSRAMLAGVLLVGSGALAPQAWLNRKSAERKLAIFKDLPDVIDLLAISVEAGMGLEGAIDIVCRHFTSPLAEELSRTLKEMELGLPRREALQHLKRRTEVPELSNFVLALTQADALGMPIGRVLHGQAAELRTKRRQWAREQAGKLPVKILFPLVVFIFPAVLVIILGPAAASIVEGLR